MFLRTRALASFILWDFVLDETVFFELFGRNLTTLRMVKEFNRNYEVHSSLAKLVRHSPKSASPTSVNRDVIFHVNCGKFRKTTKRPLVLPSFKTFVAIQPIIRYFGLASKAFVCHYQNLFFWM